jgi:hypothetical protein
MILSLKAIDPDQQQDTPALFDAESSILRLFPEVYLFETTDKRYQLRTPRSRGSALHMILCEDSALSPFLWFLALDNQLQPERRRKAFEEASTNLGDESQIAFYLKERGGNKTSRLKPIGSMTDSLNSALATLAILQSPSIPTILRNQGYGYEAGMIETIVRLYEESQRSYPRSPLSRIQIS